MTQITATVLWKSSNERFTDGRYSRGHIWQFDGGVEVPASSSPHIVALPMSIAEAVDPEEAFVAALSSCHMLCFLAIAAKRGFKVTSYRDEAIGVLDRNDAGSQAINVVTLRPAIQFSGERLPSQAELDAMHEESHEQCFIANSVKTDVRCEPAT